MPSVQAPDGRVLEFPEGTPPEQVIAVLRQHYPEQFASVPEPGGPPPAPEAGLPAAPSGPGGPPAPEPGGGGAPHIPGPPVAAGAVGDVPDFSGVTGVVRGGPGGRKIKTPAQQKVEDEMFWSLGLPSAQSMEVNPETGGNDMQNFAAGVGQSLVSTGRGIRQLWNTATGDEEDLAALEREEAEARKIDEKLLGTKAGRTGQIAGHVGQALVPAAGAAKGASLLGKALQLKHTLPAIVAAESAVGGGLGALEPTTEDESRLQNVKTGAVIGGGIPVLGRAVKPLADVTKRSAGSLAWLAKNMTPLAAVRIAEALHLPFKTAKEAKEAIARTGAARAMEEALGTAKAEGKAAVSRIQRAVDVPHAALGRSLREHVDEWGKDVPDVLRNKIKKALGDDAPRPAGRKPEFPEKPKPEKPPKEPKAPTTKKETEGQKLKRQAMENDAKRAREEMIRLAAGAKPRVGDAGRAPGPVHTITSPQKPKIPDPVNRAEKMERKANALRRGTEPPKPTGNAEADKRAMERWAAGRDPSKPFSGLPNQRNDPLLTQRATRNKANKPVDVPPQATPEYKRTQLPIERANKKRLQGVYQEARASSAQKPRLPADKPKGPPAPPRVPHGPSEGPRIKGSDLDDILDIIGTDTSKGVRAEGNRRLAALIEGHLEGSLSEAERTALRAARTRALKGDPTKLPGFLIKPSVKRQTIRAAIETREKD